MSKITLELTREELDIILTALQDNNVDARQDLGIAIQNGEKTPDANEYLTKEEVISRLKSAKQGDFVLIERNFYGRELVNSGIVKEVNETEFVYIDSGTLYPINIQYHNIFNDGYKCITIQSNNSKKVLK